jgi:hypothetical protein
MPSSPALATAESSFRAYFWPLYPDDARSEEGLAAARAADANPARNPHLLAHLDEAASVFAARAAALFGQDLALDLSDASVHRLSAAITRERRDHWASAGAAGTPESELFNVVVHGAAYVGACIAARHGGTWSMRRPAWESVVRLESRLGEAYLAVFHWWLKSLGDDALASGHTLADRYRAHVENACARPEELPILVVAAADRRLPRLQKPRYDTLHKYLKAHLPEVRDVGEHFPSPERLDELAFKTLDFTLLGDGRMVLLSGVNAHGLHLFWLDAGGFVKSAFYPSDGFPEPLVKVDADKIQVCASVQKNMVIHEMMWWGP